MSPLASETQQNVQIILTLDSIHCPCSGSLTYSPRYTKVFPFRRYFIFESILSASIMRPMATRVQHIAQKTFSECLCTSSDLSTSEIPTVSLRYSPGADFPDPEILEYNHSLNNGPWLSGLTTAFCNTFSLAYTVPGLPDSPWNCHRY